MEDIYRLFDSINIKMSQNFLLQRSLFFIMLSIFKKKDFKTLKKSKRSYDLSKTQN